MTNDEIATTGGEQSSLKLDQSATRALAVLPKGFRKSVGFFWAMNSHLFPTPTPIALRFKVWIEQDGLTVEDCRTVLRKLVRPEACSKHRFASDLLADLAGEVDVLVKKQLTADEQRRRRDLEAAQNANNLPPDAVREALAKNEFLSQFLTPDPEVTR